KVDPVGGNNCNDVGVLKNICNKAARMKGIIPANGFLNQLPACRDVTFRFDDDSGVDTETRIVLCWSIEAETLAIGRGQSEYGGYEFKCIEGRCVAVGNIASLFA
ncbi:hypothetical protein U1Q18_051217, partial [Sarracenia purpurea var. burkii]